MDSKNPPTMKTKPIFLDLANSDTRDICELANATAFEMGDDGFAKLAPFGDSQYLLEENGKQTKIIQRVSRENAPKIIAGFNGLFGKVKRWFKAASIWNGHPDHPINGHLYPDKQPKGVFRELEVRDNGIYVKPLFNEAGADLINSGKKLYFSVRWTAEKTGEKDGADVFEPINVVSAGLTPNPNLPTELLNSGGQNQTSEMNKQVLLAALAVAGIVDLSNESTDVQIAEAIRKLGTQAASVATLTNDRTAAENSAKTAQEQATTLINERNTLITHLVNEKQKVGAITEAERATWERRLTSDFANEWPSFSALEPKVKTTGHTAASGDRRGGITEAASASKKLVEMANERASKHPDFRGNRELAYAESYRAVCLENPGLFEQTKLAS